MYKVSFLNLEEDTIISLRMTVVPNKYASVAIAFSLAPAKGFVLWLSEETTLLQILGRYQSRQ
jgi:hypothetical protein